MKFLATATCLRCKAIATADTFEQARKLLNHAIGLGRGIKCGDNYGAVKEIIEKQTTQKTKQTVSTSATETKIPESPISEKTIKEKLESKTKTKPKLTTSKK